MLNNDRKQRLTSEALGNAGGEMPTAESTFWIIGIVALILYWVAAIAVASATDRYVASIHHDSPMLKKQYLAGNAEPEGKEQQQGQASKKEPEGNVQQQGEASKKEPEGNVQDLTY
jgi:hypothetical protein